MNKEKSDLNEALIGEKNGYKNIDISAKRLTGLQVQALRIRIPKYCIRSRWRGDGNSRASRYGLR